MAEHGTILHAGRGLQPRSKRLRDMASIKRCGRVECLIWLGLLLAANGVWPTVAPVWTNAQFLDGSTIKENTLGFKIAASSLGLLSFVLQQIGNQRWQHITFSNYLSIRISCSSSWRRWSVPTPEQSHSVFEYTEHNSLQTHLQIFHSGFMATMDDCFCENSRAAMGRFLPVGLENTGYLPTLFQKLRRMGC